MMKLSGWQRIWVVLGVLWLVCCTTYVCAEFPTSDAIYWSWSYALLDYSVDNDPQMKGKSAYLLRDAYSDFTNKELVHRLCKTYLAKHPEHTAGFQNIAAKHENSLQSLSKSRANMILFGFAIWLIPLAILYALGWSVGWICRGFKTHNGAY